MRLRRRRRAREQEAATAETPEPKSRVRTIIDPDEGESAQEPAAGQEASQVDELTRQRLRREFVSIEKRQRLEGTGEERGEAGQGEARLIIKERGGEIAREPRRTIGPANGAPTSAEGASGESAVLRLEKATSRPRRTHDVAVEVVGRPKPKKEGEDRWTDERKGVSWRWSVVIAGGMLGLVIMALVVVQILSVVRRGDGVRAQPVGELEVERIDLGEVKELIEADPEAIYEEACEILQSYSGAEDASEALTWVRGPERERETLLRVWRRWDSQPYFERPELIEQGVMSLQNPPALVLWGLRKDFTPFRAYFVYEDGRLRLDWRATEAFSDISPSELPEAGEVEGVTVRCVVEAKPFHTAGLPDDKYRSFLLSGEDAGHFVWGYVERDGDLDRKLEDILTRGTGERETKSRGRATLVVGSPGWRDLDNQFLIAEVLHNEWVGP